MSLEKKLHHQISDNNVIVCQRGFVLRRKILVRNICAVMFFIVCLLFPGRGKGKKTGIQNTNQRSVLNFEENLTVKSKLGESFC